MTEDLSRSYATLEGRISERTRDLEAVRDLLDAFFRISTSKMDPDNIDKTFDSVLRFCARLGYDLAMISLVDHDAGVIRAARAMGTMTGVVELTVRPLDGDDILAVVVREGRTVVVPDSRLDPRCDPAAVSLSGIRGQIILPLVSDRVLGTLQVASNLPIDPDQVDLRPLETLATHTVRALDGPLAGRGDSAPQSKPGAARPRAGAIRGRPARADADPAIGARLHGGRGRRRRPERAFPGLQPGRPAHPGPRPDRRSPAGMVAPLRDLSGRPVDPLPG